MIRKLASMFSAPAISAENNLSLENLEERQMLSVVSIFAQGSTGEEIVQVRGQQGRTIALISNLPTDGFQEFQFDFNTNFAPEDISLFFQNDLYDPANGIDRNVIVDRIEIDGVIYETENAATFSTGTWRPEDGVQSGFGRGDTLHSNGFLRYSSNGAGGVANTTLISVDVESSVTRPPGALSTDPTRFEIQIDGQTAQQFEVFGETGFNQDTVNFRARGDISPDRVRVAFTNDAVFTASNGQTVDRNLLVRSITVDGFSFNGNDPNVFSTGTYRAEDGITAGFGRGTTLHSNGYFQFSGQQQQTTEILINASGFGDSIEFELQIDGQAVQRYGLSPRAGQSSGVFVFEAQGVISPDRVRVAFVNDAVLPNPFGEGTIDRNLRINYVGIGDQFFDPNQSNVFSTGTYRAEDGITAGFGRGNVLHANGYFQFG